MGKQPFILPELPLDVSKDKWEHLPIQEFEASTKLAELNGMVRVSPKADLFWVTWLLQEAQSSNIIEGTITTFDEILGEHAGIIAPLSRKSDIQDVANYHETMQIAMEEITHGRPLTLSFIKALHKKLLQGTRGENKSPGSWRKVQVHIGLPNSSLQEASYIPPDPIHVTSLLENWEYFVHRNDINPIVQAAIMHAQFEMIHPFLDGNGRMGRLIISLFFLEKHVITKPCFYISEYLQKHRDEYYSSLRGISERGDWTSWISFFLNAVKNRCVENMSLLEKMNRLYELTKQELPKITSSSISLLILDYMFQKPIFTITDLCKHGGIDRSLPSITNIINKFCNAGIVKKISAGQGKKPAIWEFTSLMRLLENPQVVPGTDPQEDMSVSPIAPAR